MKKESYREFVYGLVMSDGKINDKEFKPARQKICSSAKDEGFELVSLTIKGKRMLFCTEKYKGRLIAARIKPSDRELSFSKVEDGWFSITTANGHSTPQPNNLHNALIEEEVNPTSKKGNKVALSVLRFK